MNAVKIRTLHAPQGDLSSFDPGAYLSGLEFYETENQVTEDERDGLAQFVHFLAYVSLSARSTGWDQSVIEPDSSAFSALESHFGHLEGWTDLAPNGQRLGYRVLAKFLLGPYPPSRG